MAPNTVFFSWQVDTPTNGGRNLIERALERAVSRIGTDTDVEEAVRELMVDRDTKDVGGFPPIVETIFEKIDKAAVFVPDLTFVGRRLDNRPSPNPNVLIEYGWALKSLGHGRIVPVMNAAFGEPTNESMPFDMLHLRKPITYNCPADADQDTRKRERDVLARSLENAIRAVLESPQYQESLPKPPAPAPFLAREPKQGHGRFKAIDEAVGVSTSRFPWSPVKEVKLSPDPVMWFRMMPALDQGRSWSVDELERLTTQGSILRPLTPNWSSYDFIRSHEGFGICVPIGDEGETACAVAFVFVTGEIWTIDSHLLAAMRGNRGIPPIEHYFRGSMERYANFLTKLGVEPPFKWIAGLEDIRGRGLFVPAPPSRTSMFLDPQGKCQLDILIVEGLYSPGSSAVQSLKPFFTQLFDSCGLSRPDWLDNDPQ